MPRRPFTLLLGIGGLVALAVASKTRAVPSPAPFVATPATATAGTVELTADLDYAALTAGASSDRNLVITVHAPDAASSGGDTGRTPVDLAVVVDTSGSMSDEGKFAEARRAMHALATELTDADQTALVTFASFTSTPVALGPASQTGPLAATLLDRMSPGGSTYLSGGLASGFAALGSVTNGRVHRVLLMTDGRANQGVVDGAALNALARSHDGVSVSTIGVGLDYDEGMLAAMADAGGGEYHYVGGDTDLAAVYAAESKSAASVVATNATLDLVFPPGVTATRACSWAYDTTAHGLQVHIGDLSAGQTRTIVVPISVSADARTQVVDATLTLSSTSGQPLSTHTSLSVPRVTLADIDAHERPDADAAATRALAGEAVDQARAAWNRGDDAAAKERLGWGSAYVRAKREEGKVGKKDAALLEADQSQLEGLGYLQASEGTKAASTLSRTMSR